MKKWVVNKFKNKDFKLKNGLTKILLSPYLVIMFLLIVVPFLFILFYSFASSQNNGITFTINFNNFIYFFSNLVFIKSLTLSIAYALLASFISLIISYPFAYILAFTKSKFLKNNIFVLISMPLWITALLKMIGLQTLFNMINPNLLGTWFSIVIGMVYLFLPFMILPIYNSLEKIDVSLIHASNDLGASRTQTFWKIIFRNSISGVTTGIFLVLVQASTSLVIIKYMGVGKINLISGVIESYFFKGSNFGFGAAISFILIVFILIILFITKIIEKKIIGKVQLNEKVF